MKTQLFTVAAMLVAALAVSPASAHYDADHAVLACVEINDYQPAIVLDLEYDGEWDAYVIWIEDVDGDVWRCTADGYGEVYENEIIYAV